jgi:hypothetical protein
VGITNPKLFKIVKNWELTNQKFMYVDFKKSKITNITEKVKG